MIINIPKALLLRAADALQYKAHNEAGQSQAPDLFGKEDTQEWTDAEAIKKLMKPPTPKCACCGTTDNLHSDYGSGGPYRCDSPDCMVF